MNQKIKSLLIHFFLFIIFSTLIDILFLSDSGIDVLKSSSYLGMQAIKSLIFAVLMTFVVRPKKSK